jgi:hypothetical protein
MSLTIDNIAPINLSVKSTTAGLRVFYGSTQVDDLLDDVFPENTALTYVAVIVNNHAGVPIDVQFDNQTPLLVLARGSTSQTMLMPEPNACNAMNVTVWAAGTMHHDPIIRLKRKLGSVTPTCTASTPRLRFRR